MNEHIFKAYDIRGIYGEELTDELSYYIGLAYGKHILELGKDRVLVGYDNRLSSIPLYNNLTKGITESGVNVIDLGLATTPMVYYAKEFLKIPSSIIITASHSPSAYNGFKFSFDESGSAYGEHIANFKEEVKEVMKNPFTGNKLGEITSYDIKTPYLEMLKNKTTLGKRKIKVVVDCGNGTGSIVAVEAFKNAGCEVVPLYCESDPTFPNHYPDPAVEENVEDLKKVVVREKADIGIGFDGDADRVGIVDEQGNMIFADYLLGILARELFKKTDDKRLLLDIKCSKAIEDDVIQNGGKVTYVRTGHSYGKKALKEGNFLLGGELSGHIYMADNFFGYDDGIYVGLRFVEILSNIEKPFSSLLEGFNRYHSTPEIKIKASDKIKFKVIDEINSYTKDKKYNTLTLDGVRVLFDDGWALVRASNTGPNITMRFEAISEERLQTIKEEFEQILQITMKKYDI
ncbi:MAG TPA: phosphomannomutase/phosphoglucomutase [Mollicutes bacterium]|nr:phosphomannomutase/phosphoglucomutase [Mollicutes bacterium]